MVNRFYRSGRAKEYKAMEMLRKDGWIVARSAASHSPVDLFAAKRGKALLIQVKSGSGRIKKEEVKELVKWAANFNADAEVWFFRGRRGVEKRKVHTSPTG